MKTCILITLACWGFLILVTPVKALLLLGTAALLGTIFSPKGKVR